MSSLWIIDSWSTLDHTTETTLRLIQAAISQGYICYIADLSTVHWNGSETIIIVRKIDKIGHSRETGSFKFSGYQNALPLEFDRIFQRPDLLDAQNITAIKLMSIGLMASDIDPEKVIVNPPSVLLGCNEKLVALNFLKSSLPSIVSCAKEILFDFCRENIKVILKPLNMHQSQGIKILDLEQKSGILKAYSVLSSSTNGFKKPVLLQALIPFDKQVERRLWFIDGELIGCAMKYYGSSSFPPKWGSNSCLLPTELEIYEMQVVNLLSLELKRLKIRIAGVDMINSCIADINFVSPGLLVELESAVGQDLANEAVRRLFISW